jgi:ABC-type spermidine/putrescine transport system permease subunit I
MYTRFSDVADYPSGAAIGVIMLVLAGMIVYAMTRIVRWLVPAEAHR